MRGRLRLSIRGGGERRLLGRNIIFILCGKNFYRTKVYSAALQLYYTRPHRFFHFPGNGGGGGLDTPSPWYIVRSASAKKRRGWSLGLSPPPPYRRTRRRRREGFWCWRLSVVAREATDILRRPGEVFLSRKRKPLLFWRLFLLFPAKYIPLPLPPKKVDAHRRVTGT